MMLEAQSLSVERGGSVLFHDFNLNVSTGSVTVVVGPNGAGKSSLLLALAGVIPASGECRIRGRVLSELSRRDLASLLAWQGELPPTEFGLTIRERLDLADDGSERLNSAIAVMELAPLLNRRLSELSSGERQRVEIAAVMARDCPLWLLDEPTAHLDLKHQMAVLRMMREEAAKGRAIVTVLHDLQQAIAVADSAVLLDGHGGAESGEAAGLLTTERLSSLFQVSLQSFQADGQSVLLPDYRP